MKNQYVNIACGDVYIDDWLNFDYYPHSVHVEKANLLGSLPVNDCTVDVVYSSHFLEHVPRNKVAGFLKECFRITKPGGVIRLVLPDLEDICHTYLVARESEAHEEADFLMLELLDQCVRTKVGGELGAYYDKLKSTVKENTKMVDFVLQRTGFDIKASIESDAHKKISMTPRKILSKLESLYCRAVLLLLPKAFRTQNVSLAMVGERHSWVYDFYTVKKILEIAGFSDVRKFTSITSYISGFPFHGLDVHENNLPRKGKESMYIEAIKN